MIMNDPMVSNGFETENHNRFETHVVPQLFPPPAMRRATETSSHRATSAQLRQGSAPGSNIPKDWIETDHQRLHK